MAEAPSDAASLPGEENVEKQLSKQIEEIPKASTTIKVHEMRNPVEYKKPDVNDLCRDMFLKLEDYLKGDLAATAEDYKLLEKMNQVTIQKYGDMRTITSNIATSMQNLNDKFKSLQPYLDQIDQVEESVANLEQAAYRLDAYSKRLELKFKQLEKR